MGYLISAHITRDKPDADRLAELPSSIGYRVYHHRSAGVFVIDAFCASRPPRYPFQMPIPAVDVPLELPPELHALELVYAQLNKLKMADSFRKSYINFGLLLSRLLGMPVLSFISDDDEWDFACTVAGGSLSRLKCRCGDLVITYQEGNVQIQPLIPEFEHDDESLTNLDGLRRALPGIFVHDRSVPWDAQLHAIASDEWKRFSSSDGMILGLGSFDLPEDEPDWTLIGSS